MLLELDDSQLLLVDYQGKLMPATHEGLAVLANASRLAPRDDLGHCVGGRGR